MADKKLNGVPMVSDIETILGVRSNGEIVQIDKSNLATLLGALRRVYFTHQHIICSLNLCKYKHFVYKLLIISVLNKMRYNSICIKGVNSHYFPVISIYFYVLYIKTQ